MANYQSTHTGAQIDAGIDLLGNNSATQGQVLTANGTGGASWQNAGGGGGASIGGGFTLIFNGNINSPIYVLCGNLSYRNTSNENISENWFGWHKITDTYTSATCNNAMCFSVSGTTFKKLGMTNPNNIKDFTGAAIDSSIGINKMYYLIGNAEMTSDD